jgi:hypothetical protein
MNEAIQWKEAIFCVNKRPWLVADPDLKARNQEFLNGIDAEYFQYCLNAHGRAEESDYCHASIAMQATLHHALETLFSLIGVLIQAPDCGYAWVAKCQTADLMQLVNRVSEKDQSLFTKLVNQEISWDGIALRIAGLCDQRSPMHLTDEFILSHGRCLGRLAAEMTNSDKRDEYNSIKHGFRIQPGGFQLWMSTDKDQNQMPPSTSDGMNLILESDYGASFFKLVPLSPSKKERALKPERVSTNWNPTRTMMLIQLAYSYIVNVHCALKLLNKIEGEHRYVAFPDLGELDKPWQTSGHSSMKFRMEHDQLKGPYITEYKLVELIRSTENKK